MLTQGETVEAHALRKQGWTISAIARHLGRDRKTVRNYLNGVTEPGVRRREEDPFEPFVEYVTSRLLEDPHLWAQTLFDELVEMRFEQSYSSLTRQIRERGLRPTCPQCTTAVNRPNAVIEHPPGEETQWDRLDLPDPPASWGWGKTAHLLVGTFACSGRWRGYLAPNTTRPQVIAGLDRITRQLGGVTRNWRFDRMATVCHPASGDVKPEFASVAKYYGVSVKICPPRAGHRKGVVEGENRSIAQRWWRTLPDELTPEQAQASLDEHCRVRADTRDLPGTSPDARDEEREVVGAHRRRHRVSARSSGGTVSRGPIRAEEGLTASVGAMEGQPVLRAAGAGDGRGHRHRAARRQLYRHCHRFRDRHRPAPPRCPRHWGAGS
ncbi:hypothetical protein GCM10023147_42550 [Tsukamurella soli]|uniref:Transposase n=1 Tax=Tsukamurella soli TaxID=644556 RepID=A0ABP8K9A5_9ACTN